MSPRSPASPSSNATRPEASPGSSTVTAEARRLAQASTLTAEDDPDIAMLLALESLDTSARAGTPALVETEEALHWSLQAAHVPYGHPDAPVEVRAGPNGPTGISDLPTG